jgi:hypothetical protein
MGINNKKSKDQYLNEYDKILKDFDKLCIQKEKNVNDNTGIINLYEEIIKKEKEIQNYRNVVRDKILNMLNNIDNSIIIDNKEVSLKEYTLKQINTNEIKEKYPDIYKECIKIISCKKINIKNLKT